MSDSTKAVFLSYASQDAEAAKRICDALRSAGVEVWFDAEGGLEHGDEWDAKIRRQIKECVLFIAVISANTQAREEGYFRIEWELAAQRALGIASGVAFILPIVIDDTREPDALVPDRFRAVQWTRLRGGELTPEVKARFLKLWSHRTGALKHEAVVQGQMAENREQRTGDRGQMVSEKIASPGWGIYAGLAVAVFALAGGAIWWLGRTKPPAPASGAPRPPVAVAPGLPAPAVSEARQLAAKARSLVDAIDSTADDFAAAEGLTKRALELDATDGEVWAVSSRINSAYLSRGFERSATRRETARSQAERAVKLAPDLPEAWLALGRGIGNTDAVRAEEAFRRGLGLAPEDGRLLLGLGSIYRQTNRFAEALAVYEQAAARPESQALARYDQYLIHFYSRRFAEADRCLRESISISKSSNMVAGLALLEVTWRGDVAQAQQALADAPASMRGQTRLVLAGVLVNLMAGQPDAALRDFDRLPADYVNDAWYTGPKGLLVGLAHYQAGRPEAARIAWESGQAVVRRRLQDSPNDLENHLRLGELLAWTGQTEAALQEARIFNELQRGRSTDWTYSTVRIHAALGRVDDALPMLEQLLTAPSSNRWPLTPALLRIDPLWSKLHGDPRFQQLVTRAEAAERAALPPRDWPKNPELKKAVGLLDGLELIPEDFRLAEEIAQRVLDRNPTDPEAVTAMARVHSMWLLRGWDRSTARYQKAKAAAERAIQLAPDEPEAYAALAIHLYARGAEPQRAVELAQRAVDLCPQESRFHRMRDNCLWVANVPAGSVFSDQAVDQENEGLRKALAAARRTVELFPKDPLVRYELSRHYRDIGRWVDFERVNEEVLALAPLANAFVWKARARFGLHGDLPGMKAVLDQVPARVRGIERTVYAYFLYAAFTGRPADGLDSLNSMTESWMIDFDYRGPKSLLTAALFELGGKKELARVQYTKALDELLRARTLNAEDPQTYLNEAWMKHGLGRADEARAALRIFNESLIRPYVISPMSTWWFQAIPANLLMGERETALTLMREAATGVLPGRATIRSRLALDPRMAPFRDDPEIKALLAEPEVKN